MQMTIFGLGTAHPPHRMTQAQALDLATQASGADEQQARLLKALYRRSGVQTRYTCLPYELGYDWFQVGKGESHGGTSVATLGPSTFERMEHYREHAPILAVAAASEALDAPRRSRERSRISSRPRVPASPRRVLISSLSCASACRRQRNA